MNFNIPIMEICYVYEKYSIVLIAISFNQSLIQRDELHSIAWLLDSYFFCFSLSLPWSRDLTEQWNIQKAAIEVHRSSICFEWLAFQ